MCYHRLSFWLKRAWFGDKFYDIPSRVSICILVSFFAVENSFVLWSKNILHLQNKGAGDNKQFLENTIDNYIHTCRNTHTHTQSLSQKCTRGLITYNFHNIFFFSYMQCTYIISGVRLCFELIKCLIKYECKLEISKIFKDNLQENFTAIHQRESSLFSLWLSLNQMELFKTAINNIQEDYGHLPFQ